MIRYRLTHLTRYDYADKVDYSQTLLKLRLKETALQFVEEQTIEIDPLPDARRTHPDWFENTIDYFANNQPYSTLSIRSSAVLRVLEPERRNLAETTPWDQIPPLLAMRTDKEALQAQLCQGQTALTAATPDLLDWAAADFQPGRPVGLVADALMARIHKEFTYAQDSTNVSTTAVESFGLKRGVCQDFAHVALAILRGRGLAARYVSGYIRTYPPPGRPRLIGADASHAWFSIFCPRKEWIDFDPTNNKLLSADHVTIGWGRDYSDVNPVRGVVLGGGGSSALTVSVDLAPA